MERGLEGYHIHMKMREALKKSSFELQLLLLLSEGGEKKCFFHFCEVMLFFIWPKR
jgi:hypothetical protein